MRSIGAAALLLSHLVVAHAQVATYECNYPSYSDGKSVRRSTEKFGLTFVVDSSKKTAYIVGNNGGSEVHLVPSAFGPTFIEVTQTGNVMTTAIANDGASVHSRGTRMQDGLVPSQYYGHCVVR